MNLDADELLARFRRDYPMPYQLVQQQLIIDKQYDEIQALKAELAAARDQNNGATAKVSASAPVTEYTVRAPAPDQQQR
jgi:hypothetical protein